MSDEAFDYSRRETDEGGDDPFDPSPIQPPGDGEPDCEVPDGAHGCSVYKTAIAPNDAYPNLPSDTSQIAPYEWPSGGDGSEPGNTWDHQEANHENTTGLRRMLCGKSHANFTNADPNNVGIGVGFVGSVRYNPDNIEQDVIDDGSTIGFARMICTPWSSKPFVRNWPFLRTMGLSYQNTERDVSTLRYVTDGFGYYLGWLQNTLANLGEWRYDDEQATWGLDGPYLRPISMKTCPPNYFLFGVTFDTREYNGDRVVRGIKTLHCRVSTDAWERYQQQLDRVVHRDLYIDGQGYGFYQMGGRNFSRTQYIGWPYSDASLDGCDIVPEPGACETTTFCHPDPTKSHKRIVGGMVYSRNSEGMIDEFGIECIEEPG